MRVGEVGKVEGGFVTCVPEHAGMPSLGTHWVAVGEIGGDVLRQLVFDLVLLFAARAFWWALSLVGARSSH